MLVVVDREVPRWEECGPPSGPGHVNRRPQRVDEQTDGWQQPKDHEGDHGHVQQDSPPLLGSAPSRGDGRRTACGADRGHRIASCSRNLRMLMSITGTMSKRRMTAI